MQRAAKFILAQEPAPPRDGRRGLADSKKRDKQRHNGAEVVARALVATRLLEGRDARNVVCQKETEDLGPRRGRHAHVPRAGFNYVMADGDGAGGGGAGGGGGGGGLAGEEREGIGEVGQQGGQEKQGRGEGRCCAEEIQRERRRQPPAQLHHDLMQVGGNTCGESNERGGGEGGGE